MTQDQKAVATGALSGIVFIAASVWLLHNLLPAPNAVDSGDKLAYAAQWLVLAAVPFFAMIVAVGNARFLSDAIDPTRRKEDPKMIINGRVADNTLQQLMLFLLGMLALSVTLPFERLGVIPAVSITFVVARIIFWVGYRIHPLYRAPGFSSVAYMNLFMFVAVFWMWLR